MHITKRQSKIFSVVALVGFVFLGIVLWQSSIPQNDQSKLKDSEPASPNSSEQAVSKNVKKKDGESVPEPIDSKFTLQNFHRSETKDGEILWELSGSEAEYFTETNSIVISDCFLLFFTEDQKKIELQSDTARLVLKDNQPTKVQAKGSVELRYDNKITIKTERAIYTSKDNLVTSPGKVDIIGEGFRTEGHKMKAYLNREEFQLSRDVRTHIDPTKNKAGAKR